MFTPNAKHKCGKKLLFIKKKNLHTDITARPFPARRTYAFEGVSFVVARTAVVTRRLVALALA